MIRAPPTARLVEIEDTTSMKLLLCVLIFCLTYGAYHLSLYPSVSGGDSGELLAEACHLGTAHPPGYPLFTVLSHFSLSQSWNFLPRLYIHPSSGDLAVDTTPTSGWKMNHLTALFAACAAVFVALTSYELLCVRVSTSGIVTNQRKEAAVAFTPAAITALLYAFSPLVWEHALGAEVFALNNLFCAIILYLTVKVIIGVYTVAIPSTVSSVTTPVVPSKRQKSKSNKPSPLSVNTPTPQQESSPKYSVTPFLLFGAFTCGLALSNQHASLLLLVMAVPTVLIATSAHTLDLPLLFQLALMFVLGLASYNYLFVASLHPKPGSWGDLSNIQGLLSHVLRTEYGTFSLGMTLGSEGFLERIWIYFLHLFDDQCGHVLLPLALVGVCIVLYEHGVRLRKAILGSSAQKKTRVLPGGKASNSSNKLKNNQPQPGKKHKGSKTQLQQVFAPSSLIETSPVKQNPSTETEVISDGMKHLSLSHTKSDNSINEFDVKSSTTTLERAAAKKTDVTAAAKKTKSAGDAKKSKTSPASAVTITQTSALSDTSQGKATSKESQNHSLFSQGIVQPPPQPVFIRHQDGQYWSVIFLISSWVFYLLVWNGVLSNIPLSAPMPYGVHARFWMQPNLILFIFVSLGVSFAMRVTFQLLLPEPKQEETAIITEQKKQENSMSIVLLDLVLQCSFVTVIFSLLMHNRFNVMDRSQDGWIMHEYGNFILQSTSAHSNALVLSHTDLNWNSIRYLQVCEGVKTAGSGESLPSKLLDTDDFTIQDSAMNSSVFATHLNFQLMPFPWFPKQQAPLYPDVIFPPMFHGVSTQRMTTENAYLVDRFLSANIRHINTNTVAPSKVHPLWGQRRPIFIDMQAINDLHIDPGGTWRNFTLIPWGMVYLVHEKKSLEELGAFHGQSLRVLKILRRRFLPLLHDLDNSVQINPQYNVTAFLHDELITPTSPPEPDMRIPFLMPRAKVPFMTKFPPGSWEHAAMSTFHDGHNQLGLNLLSYAMEMQKSAKRHGDLLIIVDRLFVASDVLLASINSIENLVESAASFGRYVAYGEIAFSGKRYKEGYAPLSTPFVHLLKNAALSLMRLESLLVVAVKFQEKMSEIVRSQDPTAVAFQTQLLLDKEYLVSKFTTEELLGVRKQAIESILTFLNVAGDDKDIPAFQKSLVNLRSSS